jgi:hypothetical protein
MSASASGESSERLGSIGLIEMNAVSGSPSASWSTTAV